ncbi:hypothetical protein [Streptosporangium sp. NPDC000396]|uniref:hypothetical protein n=1 Tax=Streptosporangium sp. NPDC000396 TaxID=3366185 RepID=UPI0036AE2D3D
MTVSVTLSSQDAFFVEDYVNQKRARSRSAAIRKAIRLLRESSLEEDHAAAFGERSMSEGARPWDLTTRDGADEPSR